MTPTPRFNPKTLLLFLMTICLFFLELFSFQIIKPILLKIQLKIQAGWKTTVIIGYIGMWNGCSFLLDPQNCTTDSECEGGVCQVGICVGSRTSNVDPLQDLNPSLTDQNMFGSDLNLDQNMELFDQDLNGLDQEFTDALSIDDPIDARIETSFECAFILEGFEMNSLIDEQEIDLITDSDETPSSANQSDDFGMTNHLLDDQSLDLDFETESNPIDSESRSSLVYNNVLYTRTPKLTLLTQFNFPEDQGWQDQLYLLIDGELIELIPIGDQQFQWSAQLNLEAEGTYQAHLIIGAEFDVRCATSLTLVYDRNPPFVQLLSPRSTEVWFRAQQGDPQALLSLQIQDRSPISIFVNEQLVVQEVYLSEWQYFLPLVEGENRFQIHIIDLLGQSSTHSLIYHYDPIVPRLNITQPSQSQLVVTQKTLSIEGMVVEGEDLEEIQETEPEGEQEDLSGGEQESMGGEEVLPQEPDQGNESEFIGHLELTITGMSSGGIQETQYSTLVLNKISQFSIQGDLYVGLNQVQLCVFDQAGNQFCELLEVTYAPPQPCIEIDSSLFTSSLLK